MMNFGQLLDKYQGDPQVRESTAKIMGAPNPGATTDGKQIIGAHTLMLEQIESIVGHFQIMPNKDSYGKKTVTVEAQALVGSKFGHKFSIISEDIESAVLMYHTILASDQAFVQININIEHIMGK